MSGVRGQNEVVEGLEQRLGKDLECDHVRSEGGCGVTVGKAFSHV